MKLIRQAFETIYVWVGLGLIAFALAVSNLGTIFDFINRFILFLQPVIVGLALAFLFNIPLKYLEKRLPIRPRAGRRIVALTIVLISFCLFVGLFLAVVLPQMLVAFQQLQVVVPSLVSDLIDFANRQMSAWGIPQTLPTIDAWDFNQIFQTMVSFFTNNSSSIVNQTVSIVQQFFNFFRSIFISLLIAVLWLNNKEYYHSSLSRFALYSLGERRFQQLKSLVDLTAEIFARYISGQLSECVILGLIFFAGMSIFRFPYASMIAMIVATFALIPVVGGISSLIIGVLLIAATSPAQALGFYAFNQIAQQIENSLIYPKVVGKSVGLPALYTLAAVLLGGSLFGVVGMLIGVPVVAIIQTLARDYVASQLKLKQLDVTQLGD